jgi:hypothetical protein
MADWHRYILDSSEPSDKATITFFPTILIPVSSNCYTTTQRSNSDCVEIDIAAHKMVDEAYFDQDDWVKRSICTTAKASEYLLQVPSSF